MVYIDDMLLIAESIISVEAHLEALIYLLSGLGLVINIPKSITIPTQQIEFLGMQVDSTSLQLCLPGEKLHLIRMEINQNLQRSQVIGRHLAQLIGKLHVTSPAVPPAPVLLVLTERPSESTGPQQSGLQHIAVHITSSPEGAQMVAGEAVPIQWQTVIHRTTTVIIRSNASLQGWGVVCNGTRTGRPWSHSEQEMYINCLELLAATLATKTLL